MSTIPVFRLGRTVMTATAQAKLSNEDVTDALYRHSKGDWGEVCEEDEAANDSALKNDERLLSVYKSASGTKFWVITEWDRSATTVLLPEDY